LTLVVFLLDLPARSDVLLRAALSYQAGLAQYGLSGEQFRAYLLVLDWLTMVSFSTVAVVIFLRRSDDWVAMLVSLSMITYGATPMFIRNVVRLPDMWTAPVLFVLAFGIGSSIICLLVFPDGRFVPGWTRWLAAVLCLWAISWHFFPALNPYTFSPWLTVAVLSPWYIGGALSLMYRYMRVADPVQRKQTKWVVLGLVLTVMGWSVVDLVFVVGAPAREPNSQQLVQHLLYTTILVLVQLAVPLSFAIAILRYHLWDIDLLINRTLVYGILTAALIGLYFASVILLQGLFRAITGERSQLAIVGSTLAIAALFSPLRRWVQDVIDWRFYRRRYDAALALAAFSVVARNETDLDSLTRRLAQVIDETVQPEHVSFWLRPGVKKVDET
jgi:hypothetical protein